MQLPGYAGYPNGMQGQQRPHMGMPQGTLAQGNMGMPQGPMSPVMSGVGNMQPPQVLTNPSAQSLERLLLLLQCVLLLH